LNATARLDPAKPGYVIVPGASGPIDGDPDEVDTVPVLLARFGETTAVDLMRQALANPDVTVATVCGGSLALAMAGLLEGRNAVTHHLGTDVLEATGVNVVAARVVDDGDLVTAGGVTSGLDLALHLLERSYGPRVALAVEALVRLRTPRHGVDRRWTHPGGVLMTLAGAWDVTIKTPIGSLAVVYRFVESDATPTGSATLKGETVPLRELTLDGRRATWQQSVTKPMRLNLTFEVVVDGDRLTGHSRAGRLPRSAVTGVRRREPATEASQ
jgi:hypothetical protein